MPNFLVELPAGKAVSNMGDGTVRMIIFAADAAGARRAAEGRYDGDGNALWATVATVTELVVGTNLPDAGDADAWTAFVRISGGAAQTVDPIIVNIDALRTDVAKGRSVVDRDHVESVVLNSGGVATYLVDDILTAAGGTLAPGGRAATFRVITVSTGVITAIELVDPGDYTVPPTPLTANPVTGGGGTAATMDLTLSLENEYNGLLSRVVSAMNVFADVANAAIDLSEGAAGARLLTLSSIADGIGDATVEIEIRHNGTPETVLTSTIVDGGIAAAVLTMAIPATPIAPPRIRVYQ